MTGQATLDHADLSARLLQLYTGAVGDVLDRHGLRHQFLPARIIGVTMGMRFAGPAYPALFVPAADRGEDEDPRRAEMLASVPSGSVVVWETRGNGPEVGHWGELMTRAVMARGCVGVVVDGGIRDTAEILDLHIPIFAAYRHPADATGRWAIAEWGRPIAIDETEINPGDYLMADVDGVVVIPRDLVADVVLEAEAIKSKELLMQKEFDAGVDPREVVRQYGNV